MIPRPATGVPASFEGPRSCYKGEAMRYEGRIFRPPSEADAYILQATIGCSWNHCTYCDMYRDKSFRLRPLEETLADLEEAARRFGPGVDKIFVADGDALVMPMEHWQPILERARALFPRLRRVSCYAMARNILAKTEEELLQLRLGGLSLLYIGPESGDDVTLKRIAKGDDAATHVEAARRAHQANMQLSVIALLGVASERTEEHARATGALVTAMDPAYFSALTVTVVPGTPLATLQGRGRFQVPPVAGLLHELRTMVAEARPTDAVFRTNHASNYLPLGGRLPADRDRILGLIDAALAGKIRLRNESSRGL
ncbi:MAG: radical SAM protein [Polyangiaceae bacterium]|nr:radical SAM protein [Polyangiaceae bacterium]